MIISEIYKRYKIMPQLAEHMLRVTAVASIICDNFDSKLDKESIITACLVHDIGNIVKFDLVYTRKTFPSIFLGKPNGYWEGIKEEYHNAYGDNEHKVTEKICIEIGVSNKILNIIRLFDSKVVELVISDRKFEHKIAPYSDMRVTPSGVANIIEKFDDAIERYAKYNINNSYSETQLTHMRDNWLVVEKQIFARCKIKPEDITDDVVQPILKLLRDFEIETI